jgi:hypothetical protein
MPPNRELQIRRVIHRQRFRAGPIRQFRERAIDAVRIDDDGQLPERSQRVVALAWSELAAALQREVRVADLKRPHRRNNELRARVDVPEPRIGVVGRLGRMDPRDGHRGIDDERRDHNRP